MDALGDHGAPGARWGRRLRTYLPCHFFRSWHRARSQNNYGQNAILEAPVDFGGNYPGPHRPPPSPWAIPRHVPAFEKWVFLFCFAVVQYSFANFAIKLWLHIFLTHSYPQSNFALLARQNCYLQCFLQRSKDLQNKQVNGRRFMYKCCHPTIRPASPRDFKSCIFYWLSGLDAREVS